MSLTLGSIVASWPVYFAPKTNGSAGNDDSAGTIGEPILAHVPATIDYRHRQIVFETEQKTAAGMAR